MIILTIGQTSTTFTTFTTNNDKNNTRQVSETKFLKRYHPQNCTVAPKMEQQRAQEIDVACYLNIRYSCMHGGNNKGLSD